MRRVAGKSVGLTRQPLRVAKATCLHAIQRSVVAAGVRRCLAEQARADNRGRTHGAWARGGSYLRRLLMYAYLGNRELGLDRRLFDPGNDAGQRLHHRRGRFGEVDVLCHSPLERRGREDGLRLDRGRKGYQRIPVDLRRQSLLRHLVGEPYARRHK